MIAVSLIRCFTVQQLCDAPYEHEIGQHEPRVLG